MKRLLPAIIGLILIIGCVVYLFINSQTKEEEIERTPAYIASSTNTVMIYREEDNLLYQYESLPRGTEVISRNIPVDVNDGAYLFTEIELDPVTESGEKPEIYYISSEYLTEDPTDVVRETTRYLRTSSVVYASPESAKIASFLKKGAELSITGYYGLQKDGSVEMYKISCDGSEGYIYSKYITDTQEAANAPYSQVASNHTGREFYFELYGGSTDTLDWYPYVKPELSSGPLLADARAVYVNIQAAQPARIDDYIDLAISSGANAMVVDIKDGYLAYESEVARELSPASYNSSFLTVDQFASSIQKIRDAGLYVIGRIVAFKDIFFAMDHPESCIESDVSDALWPSAYSRDCWYFNVALAQEAVELFGFNEIQFDYVRFPESSYGMSESESTDFKNTYNEEKAEAIQNFCFYAADQLHRVNAYLSVDVFGECVEEYVTAYGQYWPAISNIVDAISGMPYTDHFEEYSDYWVYPYTTIYEWSAKAAVRQTEIRTPAIARTWITGYDTPYWNPTVTYGSEQLIDQAQALYDSGLTGGFIPWNALSDLDKYYSYAAVWQNMYH